jgi:hypothetical protein
MTDETNPKDVIGVMKCALRLVPPILEVIAAPAMEDGARKYGPFNWRDKKVRYTVYLEAAKRHLDAIMDREDVDPDSGLHHLSHLAANVAIMADALYGGNLIDDRPRPGPAADLMRAQAERKAKP